MKTGKPLDLMLYEYWHMYINILTDISLMERNQVSFTRIVMYKRTIASGKRQKAIVLGLKCYMGFTDNLLCLGCFLNVPKPELQGSHLMGLNSPFLF